MIEDIVTLHAESPALRRAIVVAAQRFMGIERRREIAFEAVLEFPRHEGVPEGYMAAFDAASRLATEANAVRHELAELLRQAEYRPEAWVDCDGITVVLNDEGYPATVIGVTPAKEPETDPQWSDRDELAERNREYADMAHIPS